MQVGHHHWHPLQIELADRSGQQAVVVGALLVDAGDHHLIRHVASLDEVPLAGWVGGKDIQAGTDHGVSSCAQGAVEG